MSNIEKVRALQIRDKLFLFDGKGPMRYVDLTKNEVIEYKPPQPIVIPKQRFWWLSPKHRKQRKIMQQMVNYYYNKMNDDFRHKLIYGGIPDGEHPEAER